MGKIILILGIAPLIFGELLFAASLSSGAGYTPALHMVLAVVAACVVWNLDRQRAKSAAAEAKNISILMMICCLIYTAHIGFLGWYNVSARSLHWVSDVTVTPIRDDKFPAPVGFTLEVQFSPALPAPVRAPSIRIPQDDIYFSPARGKYQAYSDNPLRVDLYLAPYITLTSENACISTYKNARNTHRLSRIMVTWPTSRRFLDHGKWGIDQGLTERLQENPDFQNLLADSAALKEQFQEEHLQSIGYTPCPITKRKTPQNTTCYCKETPAKDTEK